MPVVALTGGIAAGKTVVTDALTERGVAVVDADVVAREVVEPGQAALSAIVERFGPGVLTEEGTLDRGALGSIVFTDGRALADLNAIVHPAVWQRSHEHFLAHHSAHPDIPLVYAVPLLAEGDRRDEFDLVVVVDAPAEHRVERLIEHRGMSREEAQSRVWAQATDAERLALADVVIDASGTVEGTRRQAQMLAEALFSHWPGSLSAIPRTLQAPAE